jgi:Peptidase A4 family
MSALADRSVSSGSGAAKRDVVACLGASASSPPPARQAKPVKVPLRGTACTLLALVLSVLLTQPASASPARLEATPTVNWSGYAVSGSGFIGVTGTFNVPAPLKSTSCLEETSVWVGVDGLYNHDLLQAGVAERGFTVPSRRTQTTWPAPGVAPVLCGGRAQIYAWWEDLPSGPVQVDVPVHVGDSVTVSIFKMSPGWWAVAVHDLTAKQSFFLAQRYDGPQTSVEWVVEAPDVMGLTRGPVPFSTVEFHDLDADGHAHGVERFIFSSGRHWASPTGVVASMAQLRRTGFAVTWAVRPIRPVRHARGRSMDRNVALARPKTTAGTWGRARQGEASSGVALPEEPVPGPEPAELAAEL